ncbi:ankyrin repeat-containing domain protein [Mycena capillaripes]|nr:ankyrin repeat-containing domain protein [Mycena capillaripes]
MHYSDNQSINSTPLHFCCTEGYIEGVEALLAGNVDINRLDLDESSVLATLDVRLLLPSGAMKCPIYGTALSAASTNNHVGVVRLLLKHSANINLQKIVELLLKNAQYDQLNTLEAALASDNPDIARLILEDSAVKRDKDCDLLEIANSRGDRYLDIAQLLLARDVDLNATRTLELASTCGHYLIVRLLLDKGVDINTRHDALHIGAKIVSLLMEIWPEGTDSTDSESSGWETEEEVDDAASGAAEAGSRSGSPAGLEEAEDDAASDAAEAGSRPGSPIRFASRPRSLDSTFKLLYCIGTNDR